MTLWVSRIITFTVLFVPKKWYSKRIILYCSTEAFLQLQSQQRYSLMALLQCAKWHTWWMIARRDTVEKLQLPQITLYVESLRYLHSVMRPHAKCTWRNLHVHQPCNQPTLDVLDFSVMIQGSQCGDHCVGTFYWRYHTNIRIFWKFTNDQLA